jgi:hypothetical protein
MPGISTTAVVAVPTSEKALKSKLSETSKKPFSFSGHETFAFRYAWLKKAVDAVAVDPNVFNQEDAVVTLGVGKNMVRSMRHWGLATGVLTDASTDAPLAVTPFGSFIFGPGGKDPYLEDPNTLWLLHWNICRQPARSTTWNWAFNGLPSNEFTRESLQDLIAGQLRHHQAPPQSEAILKRDVEIFIRTYVAPKGGKTTVIEDTLDCPLVELRLVDDRGTGKQFQLRRGPKPTLSSYIFAYALLEFWSEVAADRDTLAFSEIAFRSGSPGSLFKLDENTVLERLDQLDHLTKGALTFAETAGVRQVYRKGKCDAFDLLQHYYDSESVGI